jgi:hypothetical protein
LLDGNVDVPFAAAYREANNATVAATFDKADTATLSDTNDTPFADAIATTNAGAFASALGAAYAPPLPKTNSTANSTADWPSHGSSNFIANSNEEADW